MSRSAFKNAIFNRRAAEIAVDLQGFLSAVPAASAVGVISSQGL